MGFAVGQVFIYDSELLIFIPNYGSLFLPKTGYRSRNLKDKKTTGFHQVKTGINHLTIPRCPRQIDFQENFIGDLL
ncbi:MAG: hypothetical protein B6230_07175 [Desulfobacteraceae bacterium 4572_89]|nr:MAG: hypothetical protein B6230_07175 [Desulfobacteraceae bacterium 4572_89]